MYKKFLIWPLIIVASLLPVGISHGASKANVTKVRVVTRNDADIPFVRTVLDVTGPVQPRFAIDKSGYNIVVTIPNTNLSRSINPRPQVNQNVISRLELGNKGPHTEVRIRVPKAVNPKDLKVFTLDGNAKQKISNRVVIDVNDKSGKIQQWSHWHDSKDSISKPFSESIKKGFKGQKPFAGPGKGDMIWPVKGVITSPFGYRIHPIYGRQILHSGMDIGVDYGTPVKAALDGVVVEADWISGYGNTVIIDHGNGMTTLYGHNERLNVETGQNVKQGDIIAYAGSTGNSTGPHVHFEIRVNGEAVDPALYL